MVGPWVETSNKSVPNAGLGLVMVCWSVDWRVVLSRLILSRMGGGGGSLLANDKYAVALVRYWVLEQPRT